MWGNVEAVVVHLVFGLNTGRKMVQVVAQLVEALCYKRKVAVMIPSEAFSMFQFA
jgi:hypothetical protein